MPPDQFGKRGLGPAFGVIAQKLLVGQPVHSWKSSRRCSNRTGIKQRKIETWLAAILRSRSVTQRDGKQRKKESLVGE